MLRAVLLLLLLLGSALLVTGAKKRVKRVKAGKKYTEHEEVHIVVNKVGPFNNPTETYRYYSFPFCQVHHEGEDKEEQQDRKLDQREGANPHNQRLGESIVGDRRETSPYDLTFIDVVDWRLLCKQSLSTLDLEKLKNAIHEYYFFEMFVEDLPMWGYIGDFSDEDFIIGEVPGSRTYLFTHLHFTIGYNDEMQIVSAKVNTDTDRRLDITETHNEMEVQFSYSVEWTKENIEWKDRHAKYSDSAFPSSLEIHWLSIINSFVLVLLLTAFLTIIMLRILKNDFSRYMEMEEEAIDEEETGWKLIHGDVFRFPENARLFCAAVGTGNHLVVMTLCHLSLALSGIISTTRRGSIMAGVVVLYCMTAFVGGYTSVRLCRQMGDKDWVRCTMTTAALFPTPVVVVFFWVNTLALVHGSTSALPLTAILTVSSLFMFICIPMTVVGASMAKKYASPDFNAPTRTTKVAREIPMDIPFYRGRSFQVLIAGFLPFSAIYIELHYIFASIWGHQIYTLFGILFVAFILLLIVTSFITVALLYFQLAREDHRWWWTTYINGGMTGVFIFLYSFYFYSQRSGMSGLLQTSFYFGYMTVISFAFFLMLGSTAFQFSLVFVRYIYSRIKSD